VGLIFFCLISTPGYQKKKLEAQNDPNNIRYIVEVDLEVVKEEGKHWCYSENREFCE